MNHVMKLHPFDQCVTDAVEWIKKGATIYQQFNCEACGTKQTMEQPNKMFMQGTCEECKHVTDIKKNGCNYMAHFNLSKPPEHSR